MKKAVVGIMILLLMAAVAIAATIDSVPLVPGGVRGSDKVPLGRVGVNTSYTASMDQIKTYIFGNNTSAPGVYTFNGRPGAVVPQAGDYTAAQVGADPSGAASAAVATHNSVYNHLNIPTNQQIGAMTGTSGTPSVTNAFVTNSDSRNSNARTPTAHAASHGVTGTDPVSINQSQVVGLSAALDSKQPNLTNATTLGKIGESGNLPLWNNAAWPGGAGGGGDMYKATYDPNNHAGDAFSLANHTGSLPYSSITGLAASATIDTTTTANISPSSNKRFITDAQQAVLINTSGINSGDVSIGGTGNGLSLVGQQLSLQVATNAQPGALSAADHAAYAQAASLAATSLQPSSTLDASKLAGTTAVNTTGTATNVTGTVAIANGGTGATTAAAALAALGAQPAATAITTSNIGSQTVTNVTGTVAITNGGTGATTAAAALTALGAQPAATAINTGNIASQTVAAATGNAGSATKLQTARTINSIPFDGTANITVADATKAPIDNPTFTTGATAPVFTSNAADGTHMVFCANTGDMTTTGWGTADAGKFCYNAATGKYRYWNGTALSDWTGGSGAVSSVNGVTGAVTTSQLGAYYPGGTDVPITDGGTGASTASQALTNLGAAPKASPTFTGTVTLPITGTGNQCVRVSSTGVVSGTGSDCGTGTGGGSGTVNNSSVAYHLAGYATTGTTVSDSGIEYAIDGSTITTAKVAGSADAQLFRAAPDLTGAGFMGPATSTTTPYYLQLPAAPPTNGQIAIFGTPASGTVNGATANIVPVTYGANGSVGGISALTGDVTASGTGSVAATVIAASTAQAGKVQLTDSVTSTSTTTAATPNSVKQAYDLAATKGTGTVTAVSVASANGVSGTSSGGATPALTISLGAITPSSVSASGNVTAGGLIDGTAPTVLTTTSSYTLGSSYKTNYTLNNYATASQAIVYTLPTAAAGRTECVRNYTSKTGTLRVNTSAAGQYIDMDGTNSASGGYVISGGALGDAACFVGADSTHWVMYTGKGTWTLN